MARTCIYCPNEVESANPNTDFCRTCYYTGRHHANQPRFSALIAKLNGLSVVDEADVRHTGGGCFGIEIALADDPRFLFATVAVQEENGEWSPEAWLPENDNDRWSLGIYASEDAFMDGCEDIDFRQPLTDDQLVDAVRELLAVKS